MSTLPTQPFASRPPERTPFNIVPWAIAAVVVLILVAALLIAGHRKPLAAHTPLPPDPYAASLVLSDLQMSESTSISGGKSTFIDGRVRNAGPRTVTAVTVQVLFSNDEALPPQVETLPLTLIRAREPYVDTQLIAAAPLQPGDQRDFRLIFESIGANWNQNLPQIHVVHVATR